MSAMLWTAKTAPQQAQDSSLQGLRDLVDEEVRMLSELSERAKTLGQRRRENSQYLAHLKHQCGQIHQFWADIMQGFQCFNRQRLSSQHKIGLNKVVLQRLCSELQQAPFDLDELRLQLEQEQQMIIVLQEQKLALLSRITQLQQECNCK